MKIAGPGVITVSNWTLTPTGEEYRYFWCAYWRIITDKEVGVEGFRSTEKWQLLAIKDGHTIAVFPGCQVKAWMGCKTPPASKQCFPIDGR